MNTLSIIVHFAANHAFVLATGVVCLASLAGICRNEMRGK